MKYLYIELNYFKRFSLNNIDHFSMHITDPLQLILGTNGSGKSSLLDQLTPLPAHHLDYAKQGSKVIKIAHNQYTYTLKSSFFPSQKHSFLRDGVELNEGGTVTVQKELVKHQFGITPEIHELLLGKEPFDRMSSSRRKEWFIKLCDTNYDYAIKVYNKLREKHRDAQGAIKLAKKRLVHESEKLIQTDEENILISEAKSLHECMSHLLEYRMPVEKDLDTLQINQSQLDESLTKVAKSLNALVEVQSTEQLTDLELDERIVHADNSSIRSKALIERYAADFLKNQNKIDALQKAEQQTIESLEETLCELTRARQTIQSKSLLPEPILKAKVAMDAFQAVKFTLSDVFASIPSNKEKTYSQAAVVLKKERLSNIQVEKSNLIENLQAKQNKLKHMTVHKDKPDLQCPSCHHKFSLNYNDEAYQKLKDSILTLEVRLEKELNPEIALIETYLQSCSDYAQQYKQYAQCVNGWVILSPYWDYLNEKKVITDNPQSGIIELSLIEKDLLDQITQEDMLIKFNEKAQLLVSLKDVGGADLNTLIATNEEINDLLSEETSSLKTSTQLHKTAVETKARIYQISLASKKITELIQKKRQVNKDEIETIRRIELNNAIRQIQSALATREHVLNNLALQKGIVENVTQQIFDLEKEEEALSILVKQLSPTEGLIAEGLLGFIRNFIAQMNSFIKKIWAYPLVIQSCDVLEDTSVDLDYKFPMMVQSSDNIVSDVSKGSEGMKEIVNLAHRLIAMRYLGLQDSPLMLDEWGATLDTAHRGQATNMIKSLIEQQTFSQLFMISHYEASYGALSNAQVCVLNGMNITVPKLKTPVNSHVVMR